MTGYPQQPTTGYPQQPMTGYPQQPTGYPKQPVTGLVSVTVPQGYYGGQTISVRGTRGQTFQVQIPQGLGPGKFQNICIMCGGKKIIVSSFCIPML